MRNKAMREGNSGARLTGMTRPRLAGLLIDAVALWLPDAIRDEAPHWTEPFGHAFAGQLMLADWIGSDSTWFEFPNCGAPDDVRRFAWALPQARKALVRRRLAPDAERQAASRLTFDCQTLIEFPTPSDAQKAMLSLVPAPDGRICLIEDETGSGKTEAALIHFIDLFRQG